MRSKHRDAVSAGAPSPPRDGAAPHKRRRNSKVATTTPAADADAAAATKAVATKAAATKAAATKAGAEKPATQKNTAKKDAAKKNATGKTIVSKAGAPEAGAGRGGRRKTERFAAIDLGTNNCRLLIAAPRGRELRIVDAYSCIVRLGEGLAATGELSEPAIDRALGALTICAEKISRRGATRVRCIATQACRGASNGRAFLDRVAEETGLAFEIITPQEEARLAVQGCADLLDETCEAGLVFDIGGGSVELSWVRPGAGEARAAIAASVSMPFGVVSLAEKWGGRDLSEETYADLVKSLRAHIAEIGDPAGMGDLFARGGAHYLGTSGTITSVAGVHLGLAQYRRDQVDGLWLHADEVRAVAAKLRAMSFAERAAEPCIGEARADLVVCGCAILDALLMEWPAEKVRVADRGLREGVLADLAAQAKRERRRRSRRRGGKRKPA